MTTTTPTTDDAARDAVADLIGGGADVPRTRKPRGRPRRAAPGPRVDPETPAEPLPELKDADVRVFVQMASDYLGARNPILAMTPAEADRLTAAGTAFANKYGAAFMRYSVEIAFAFAVGSYGFRVYGDLRREQAARARTEPKPIEASEPSTP